MKKEKAIECVENVLCATVLFDGTLAYELTIDDTDWLETAKEALEKQIPKKPISFEDEAYLCPNCLRNNFYNGTETLNKMDFCDFCWQAIDWSDGERKENDC